MEGSKKAYRVQYPDEYITDTGMMHTGYRYALNRSLEGRGVSGLFTFCMDRSFAYIGMPCSYFLCVAWPENGGKH